ncbi:hypothetical protein [Cupriavidus campinensis]
MNRLLARHAALMAWGLAAAAGAHGSDIACQPTPPTAAWRCDDSISASPHCRSSSDRRPPGQRMICDYAMLNRGYALIHDDQRRLLRDGRVRMADVQTWRNKRDACTTVPCLDAVFAEWWRNRPDRPSASKPAPAPAQAPAAIRSPRERLPHEPAHAAPSPVPAPVTAATSIPAPIPTSTPSPTPPLVPDEPSPPPTLMMEATDSTRQSSLLSTVRDMRPPLRGVDTAPATAPESALAGLQSPVGKMWLLWLALLMVASVALDWLRKRRARALAPPGGRRHAVPRVTVLLCLLLAVNAALLLAVFAIR